MKEHCQSTQDPRGKLVSDGKEGGWRLLFVAKGFWNVHRKIRHTLLQDTVKSNRWAEIGYYFILVEDIKRNAFNIFQHKWMQSFQNFKRQQNEGKAESRNIIFPARYESRYFSFVKQAFYNRHIIYGSWTKFSQQTRQQLTFKITAVEINLTCKCSGKLYWTFQWQ